jgi:hypothetical protein
VQGRAKYEVHYHGKQVSEMVQKYAHLSGAYLAQWVDRRPTMQPVVVSEKEMWRDAIRGI